MRQAHQRMVNLAYRLDALSAALARLEADPTTEPEARRLVTLIRAAGEWRQWQTMTEAACQAETSSSTEFPSRLRALIDVMRQETAVQQADGPVVLIVSTDATLIFPLRNRLTMGRYHVLTADTSETVRQIIATNPVSFCIVDLVMAGLDGRRVITELRANAATAALPIIAIIPQGAGTRPSWPSVRDADGCFEKPVSPDTVADFIALRRKRGPLAGLEARRDPGTSLLNRAACREAYLQTQETGVTPNAFILLGIHRFAILAGECGPAARDELLRRFGNILSSSFRSTDITARWDLAEFAVILSGEDPYGATMATEKILAVLNAQTVMGPGQKELPVTVCAGITVIGTETPIEEAASLAERHLYAAFRRADDNAPLSERLVSDTLPASRRSETIALCLADELMARIVCKVLEHETFAVELFTSAEKAASQLARSRVDLAILDDDLPDNGAFTIIDRITQANHSHVPRILMFTADEGGTRQAMRNGADDFVIRPPDLPSLLTQVRRLLRQDEMQFQAPSFTVLIADREISQLMLAGTALHQLGDCRVLLAHGAKDALRRLSETKPDILILDTHLTGVSGSEFLSSIPEAGNHKGLEVILATDSLAGPGPHHDRFKILGSVTRPYKPVSFVEELRDLIPLPHARTLSRPALPQEALQAEVSRLMTLSAS